MEGQEYTPETKVAAPEGLGLPHQEEADLGPEEVAERLEGHLEQAHETAQAATHAHLSVSQPESAADGAAADLTEQLEAEPAHVLPPSFHLPSAVRAVYKAAVKGDEGALELFARQIGRA